MQAFRRWRDPDLNRGHHDFQSCALPTELSRRWASDASESSPAREGDPEPSERRANVGLSYLTAQTRSDWVSGVNIQENLAQSDQIGAGMTSTKRLLVLRHAKSSWDNPGLDDHERPLAPRGQRALEVMSSHMKASGIEPQLVLCSSSRRTRETLAGMAVGGEHLIEPALYSAGCEEVLNRLRDLPDHISTAMLIGHNPAVQVLVLRLTNHDGAGLEDPRRDAIKRKFPTGALATVSFQCAWNELATGRGRLEEFITPKGFSGVPEAVGAAPGPRVSTGVR